MKTQFQNWRLHTALVKVQILEDINEILETKLRYVMAENSELRETLEAKRSVSPPPLSGVLKTEQT
jgi:hypothetical protein